MNESTFENTVRVNAPFKDGRLMHSIVFEHNAYWSRATYDTNLVPYIKWQNEGFTHYITKQKVDVNKGFIERKTVGALNRIEQSEILGLPYSYETQNNELAMRENEILISQGVITRVI